MIQIVKWILDKIYHEDSDVQAELSSIGMDDVPCGLRKDFEGAVAFLFTTDLVPKKRKEKRSVEEISATIAKENKTCG